MAEELINSPQDMPPAEWLAQPHIARLGAGYQKFLWCYLNTSRASRAAAAGGFEPTSGWGILHTKDIQTALAVELPKRLVTPDQVRLWLTGALDMDMADYDMIVSGAETLKDARERGVATWLIKKCKPVKKPGGKIGYEIELIDAQGVVDKLMKLYGMLVDLHEHTLKDVLPVEIRIVTPKNDSTDSTAH